MTFSKPEQDWLQMVAHFAAKHVRSGVSHEEAVRRGVADYTAFLDRWADTLVAAEMTARDGRPNRNNPAWKAREGLYAIVSRRVHHEVRAEVRS